jgi:hypothetical protein
MKQRNNKNLLYLCTKKKKKKEKKRKKRKGRDTPDFAFVAIPTANPPPSASPTPSSSPCVPALANSTSTSGGFSLLGRKRYRG